MVSVSASPIILSSPKSDAVSSVDNKKATLNPQTTDMPSDKFIKKNENPKKHKKHKKHKSRNAILIFAGLTLGGLALITVGIVSAVILALKSKKIEHKTLKFNYKAPKLRDYRSFNSSYSSSYSSRTNSYSKTNYSSNQNSSKSDYTGWKHYDYTNKDKTTGGFSAPSMPAKVREALAKLGFSSLPDEAALRAKKVELNRKAHSDKNNDAKLEEDFLGPLNGAIDTIARHLRGKANATV